MVGDFVLQPGFAHGISRIADSTPQTAPTSRAAHAS
jgi:hypothetical protein